MRTALLFLMCSLLISCAQAEEGWDPAPTWAFTPAQDDFRPDALLDLRYLNEKVAGESGYLRTNSNGEFFLGNGQPVRFWAVNTDTGREMPWTARPLGRKTEPDLARHARFLAKRGVNMARLHVQISPDPGALGIGMGNINEGERDYAWRAVAAMKKEGIYTTLSLYWGARMGFNPSWGVAGDPKQSALGLLYFDPKMQAAYKQWLRETLTPPNPYTGIPLAKEPALGIFQLQNEDSLLFWTVNNIAGPQRDALEKLFGEFLIGKHGSPASIARAWQNDRSDRDAPSAGRYELLNIWELTQARTGGRHVRLSDQAQFYAQTMAAFNRTMTDFIRNELGCKALINAGNWRTADMVKLNDLERWSYLPGEVDAVNRYFGGIHKGVNEGWAIVAGDKFTNDSALRDPKSLPINIKQTAGRPILTTESAWVMPNSHGAEGPFLIGAYSSLTGVDAYYWFATGDDEWSHPGSANGYMPSQSKWMFASPDMLGTFPAAALMYRTGMIRQAAPTVIEERSLQDLWDRRTPIIAEESGFDPNRDSGDIAPTSGVKTGVDPLAFLTGPVLVRFGGDPARTRVNGLKPLLDASASTVTSSTGEVKLNYAKGYSTVDAPLVQGVAAHFKNQPEHRLSDVTIVSRNTFGSVLAVSLDGKPLRASSRILVQVGTQSRPTGWEEAPASIDVDGGRRVAGWEVKAFGTAPWRVQRAQVDVTVKNTALTTATTLDMNGNAIAASPLTRIDGGVKLTFPADAMYVMLQ